MHAELQEGREGIKPIYRPYGGGSRFLLYDGELLLEGDDGTVTTAPGQVDLHLFPRSRLYVHVFGTAAVRPLGPAGEIEASIPESAPLAPPQSAAEKQSQTPRLSDSVNPIVVGNISKATHLVIHVSGALDATAPQVRLSGGGYQRQLDFSLPGWSLVLVPGERTSECRDFVAVIRAAPESGEFDLEDVERLHRRLFILLGFIANRECGVGPVCGLDDEGRIVWAEWAAPRLKPGNPGIGWSTRFVFDDALPELAAGLAAHASDPAMEKVIDRAIGYCMAANGDEVIDVRIPIACSGLELLSWAALQRQGLIQGGEERRKHGAHGLLRMLLEWADIPIEVPSELDELDARRRRSCDADAAGPDVVFNVRNGLVHPPRRLEDPEWPEEEEMLQAWQLATWYLELALLRTLGYDGEYWRRIALGRQATDVEPVPWATK